MEKHGIGASLPEQWCADFDAMVFETGKNSYNSDAVAAGNLLWMQLHPDERIETIKIARRLRTDVKLYKAFMEQTDEERVNALFGA